MPSTSLITSRSCTFHLFLFLFSFLQLFSWTKTTPTMDHPLMHSRRSSSSVFMKVVKEDKEEEDYDDLAEGEEEEEKEDEEGGELEVEECYQKKKRMKLGGGSTGKKGSTTAGCSRGGVALVPLPVGCQVDNCDANLADSKRYHQRHKVCEYHAKAQVVMTAGQRQRFCQQCSRFHELSEFDNAKRSCRTRLAGHNERRRKHFSESRGGSATGIKKNQCRQVDEKGRTQMAAFA